MSPSPHHPKRSVLRHLDTEVVRTAARHESRMRQHHLPPVSVYRWWARRTEAVSGAVIDAVAKDHPAPLFIADPFSGGGVIALAALMRGHRVYAQDVNPWAARSLVTMLDLPRPEEIEVASRQLHDKVTGLLREAYATSFADGSPAEVSQTLRVATVSCPGCARVLRLFPAALVSLTERVDGSGGKHGFTACPAGHLQLGTLSKRARCATCDRRIDPAARYTTGRRATCIECGWSGRLVELAEPGGLTWEVVLVERVASGRREIDLPTDEEDAAADETRWRPVRKLPSIAASDETAALRSFGAKNWHDLFPNRQRVVLEALLKTARSLPDTDSRTASALEAAVLGSVEMAGYVSRWDPRYLKAYEAIANHRFNFTTLAAEPNVWGAGAWGRGTVSRRLQQMVKASAWIQEQNGSSLKVEGPVPATRRRSNLAQDYDVRIVAGSSERLSVPGGALDAVVTDPPYHDDVQYAQLSDLFRAWSGGTTGPLTGDAVAERHDVDGFVNYEARLTSIFSEIRRALKTGGHLVLSYANREPGAWIALLAALQNAGFRALGYSVVHSENETDHAKIGRRACTLDVLVDLVADDGSRVYRFRPLHPAANDEEHFCRIAGSYALRVGSLAGEWKAKLRGELSSSNFLSSERRRQYASMGTAE